MDIRSVFILKASTASSQNPTQNVNQASSPVLQSLEEDRKFNRGFEFGLKKILSGNFDEDFIDSLVDPKFDSDGYLVKNRRFIADRNNNLITRGAFPELKSLNLRLNDAEVLKRLFQINSKNQQFAKETQLNLKAISFALKKILSGNFDEDFIDSLVDPKFDSDGYLVKNRRFIADRNNNLITRGAFPELEKLNLNPDDAETLKAIQRFCSKPEFPDKYKKNFSEFLSSGDTNILKNFKSSLESQEVREETQELIQVIDKLVKSTEVLNLKKEIYTGIVGNRDTNELRKLVNNYEAEGLDDINLKRELLKATVEKDEQDIIVRTVEKLEERNPDAAIAASAPLLAINLEAAQGLRKLAYRLELSDYRTELEKRLTEDLNTGSLDFSKSSEFLRNSPLRPAIGELDYIKSIQEIQEETKALIQDLIPIRVRQQATELRGNFGNNPPEEVLRTINTLSTQEPTISAELRELYKTYATANLPEIFETLFLPQIQEARALELQSKFTRTELGGNLDAFKYMQENFVAVVLPLVESLRANPRTSKEIGVYLENDRNGVRGKTPFEQRLSQLKKQRDLSKIEVSYLRSVERLSLFNPYLVACAAVKPGITSEYLKIYFQKLSSSSKTQIQDGAYIPLIQIGTGPNGLAGIGEIVRNNPDLANSILVIDSGKQPGGPFAVPNGAAWNLNSANARGASVRVLPDKSETQEELTVRGFGSPLRYFPGERKRESTIREGSINATVDFLTVPDEISSKRYATNQELQLVLAMQAALLVKNLALETEIIKIEPNQDKDLQGDKIVTLRIKEEGNSSREVKIRTDAIFCSSGLGEPTYGFPIDDTKQAQQILQEQRDDEFPKLSTTLEAFKALADIENPRKIKGNTVVIYGGGNSADTLLEYFGNLFNGSNDSVNKIEKIYVLLPGELSSRPRYAQIRDLTARNGNSNLIEFINAKVGDVAYASGDDKSSNRLILLDKEGNSIKDKSSREIVSDYVIAATGFKSGLDKVLEDYAEKIPGSNESELRKKLGLPTNPDITVAETLSRDPNILIFGTASSSNFNSEKLGQLPLLAREALLRNGAENAVAIGFRGPDTQAAVSIWLNQREITLGSRQQPINNMEIISIILDYSSDRETTQPAIIPRVNLEEIKIPSDISDASLLLEPLFYRTFGNRVQLIDDSKIATNQTSSRRNDSSLLSLRHKGFRGQVNFTLTYDRADELMRLDFSGDRNGLIRDGKQIPEQTLPDALIRNIVGSLTDCDFQKYALIHFNNRRGANPSLSFSLNFRNGYLNPAKSFIEA